DGLSGGRGPVVHPDGDDSRAGRDLRPSARDGEADRMTTGAGAIVLPRERRARSKAVAFARRHALTLYALLAFGYLLLPVAVVVAFSFNNPRGRFNYTWHGFTFDNCVHLDSV